MARVIRIEPELEKQVIHKKCGALIGYYPKEIQSGVHHDYGGGSDIWYYIICPNCGDKIEVYNR